MNSSQKTFEKILYSGAGIFLLFLIILLINVIASVIHFRVDLTQEGLYTLSPNSKQVLSKLDSPITIKFYCTRSNSRMPAYLRSYGQRIEDLLAEYRSYSRKNITLEKYDPVPDSDAEDAAALDGVNGQLLNTGERIYLGVAISCFDKTISIPFLAPQKENVLEYEITRAITQVTKPKKALIGVMSPLPVIGGMPTQEMIQAGKYKPERPWASFKEILEDFDVRTVPMEVSKIDDSLKLLILVHPAGLSEKSQFAIDQYLLKGGKLIVFVDPKSFFCSIKAAENKDYISMQSSDLPVFFKTWGVKYSTHVVVADMTFAKRIEMPEKMMTFACALDITKAGFNKKEVLTGQLDKISMFFAGFFSGDAVPGLKKTVMMKSTKDSQPVSALLADKPELVMKAFQPGNKELELAISLEGKFKSAFPDGFGGNKDSEKEKDKDAAPKKKGAADKKATADANKKEAASLKESVKDSTVILIADSDILVNDACVQLTKTSLGQSVYVNANDNINFFQNMVEHLTGDVELIGIRCRAVSERPFEIVKGIRSNAEQKFKNKIVELERSLMETQASLNKLQKVKADDQKFILSPEQQAELKKYKAKEAEAKKELKKLRKQFRSDIDSLENKLMWFNIALVPILVTITGISFAIYNRRRHSAK